jgi:hypothetical protein
MLSGVWRISLRVRPEAGGVFAIVFSPGGSTSADITTDGGQFADLFHAYLANPTQ